MDLVLLFMDKSHWNKLHDLLYLAKFYEWCIGVRLYIDRRCGGPSRREASLCLGHNTLSHCPFVRNNYMHTKSQRFSTCISRASIHTLALSAISSRDTINVNLILIPSLQPEFGWLEWLALGKLALYFFHAYMRRISVWAVSLEPFYLCRHNGRPNWHSLGRAGTRGDSPPARVCDSQPQRPGDLSPRPAGPGSPASLSMGGKRLDRSVSPRSLPSSNISGSSGSSPG